MGVADCVWVSELRTRPNKAFGMEDWKGMDTVWTFQLAASHPVKGTRLSDPCSSAAVAPIGWQRLHQRRSPELLHLLSVLREGWKSFQRRHQMFLGAYRRDGCPCICNFRISNIKNPTHHRQWLFYCAPSSSPRSPNPHVRQEYAHDVAAHSRQHPFHNLGTINGPRSSTQKAERTKRRHPSAHYSYKP